MITIGQLTDKHAMITSTGDHIYPYIQQLASLDTQQPQQKLPHLPADLQKITTPLHLQKFNGKSYCKAIQIGNSPNI